MLFTTNSVAGLSVGGEPTLVPWPLAALFGALFVLILGWAIGLRRRIRDQQHRLRRHALTETTLRARQRELLDTVSDLVFVLTRDGRFCEMNRAAESAFGGRIEDFAGESIYNRIAPHDRPKLLRLLAGEGPGLGDRILELMVRDDRGFTHVIQLTAWRQASRDRGGGFYVVARDITAWKAIAPALLDDEPAAGSGDPEPPRRGSGDIWSHGE
jgi:PAS domain S-box-containing protein